LKKFFLSLSLLLLCTPSFAETVQWTPEGKKALITRIQQADQEGLHPGNYRLKELEAAKDKNSLAADQLFTDVYFRYGSDLLHGVTRPDPMTVYWIPYKDKINTTPLLKNALLSGDLDKALNDLEKQKPGYEPLKKALAQCRQIASQGGWSMVPNGPRLRKGTSDPRIVILRKRLEISGDMSKTDAIPLFDQSVEEGLKNFQERHGLTLDGVLGNNTLAALNVPVRTRIRQIILNMERRRWMGQIGDRHLLVIVPDFRLYEVENQHVVTQMKVVVGQKEDWQTPILSSQITHLVLNPQWHVPANIIKKELLDKIREDPDYLKHEHLQAFHVTKDKTEEVDAATFDFGGIEAEELKLVQKEGRGNALGRIKFLFPNPFEVYLHDTPQQQGFNEKIRTLSHGCVRVEKPMELMEFLVQGHSPWTKEDIQKKIDTQKIQVLTLPEPVKLHILYWTSWVDKQGRVQFREDIYEKDKELSQAMRL
jgi:murein L,D-transpeptidase YcbB/YkuD